MNMTKRKYYQFGRKHFEYEMRGLLIKNKLGFMEDITDELSLEGPLWERVYKVSTKNKSLDIIVYSSVDIRTNYVRENSMDAVRLVLRWKTKSGYVYKKISKHLRIETLFFNIKKSLIEANKEVFNLNYREFAKESA